MKDRIMTGWSYRRVFYILAGGGLIVLSIPDRQWLGVVMGIYFIAMGVFAFGCAGGNCTGGACARHPSEK